jgi:hypothetical protein
VAYRNGGGRTLDNRGEACKAIHTELAWSDHANSVRDYRARFVASLRLCRMLVDAGHDPAGGELACIKGSNE